MEFFNVAEHENSFA